MKHLIGGHGAFRPAIKYLMNYNVDEDTNERIIPYKNIYVTATPEIVEYLPNIDIVRVNRQGSQYRKRLLQLYPLKNSSAEKEVSYSKVKRQKQAYYASYQ